MVDSDDDVSCYYQLALGVETNRDLWVLFALLVHIILEILLLIDQLIIIARVHNLQNGFKPSILPEPWYSSDHDLLKDLKLGLVFFWLC